MLTNRQADTLTYSLQYFATALAVKVITVNVLLGWDAELLLFQVH